MRSSASSCSFRHTPPGRLVAKLETRLASIGNDSQPLYIILQLATAAAEYKTFTPQGGSIAEWLACWTQAQKARVQIAVATLSGNSLRQTAHTHCTSVRQAVKLVAAPLRVAEVTAGLTESNGSLPPGL